MTKANARRVPLRRNTTLAILILFLSAPAAAADRTAGYEVPGLGGRVHLDALARFEIADIDGSRQSEAWTLRTRLGYGTAQWRGLSAYAELESVLTPDDNSYFDGVAEPNGRSIIADPTEIELNRAFVTYRTDRWNTRAVAGRQRIKLDDDRFVGNIGWRQNEQTYDAALGETSLGVEGLSLTYAYIWEVQRIFGDDGPANRRDFDSDTHLVRVGYDFAPWLEAAAFAYLMNFDNSPGNSADSFGLRVSGEAAVADGLTAAYQASYAHQTDAGRNPVDYDADYFFVDGAAKGARWGAVGVGYEVLGSDGGKARFVTPLATAHKFNGWADAFLDNGGAGGLRDLYLYAAPKLPCGFTSRLVYHWFDSDDGGSDLGEEVDAIVSRAFGSQWVVLAKFAYFDARNAGGRADTVRGWLQVELKV